MLWAAPSAAPDSRSIDASVVAGSIVENYGTARANATQLDGLEASVRELRAIANKGSAKR